MATAAQPNLPVLPGVQDVANGLNATNGQINAILFILVVVILAMLAERIIAGWRMTAERKAMWTATAEFGAAAKEFTKTGQDVIAKIEVLSLIAAAAAGRAEAVSSKPDDRR